MADLVPKPVTRLPVLVTGSSRQDFAWIAAHADGWITYPRALASQAELVAKWRAAVAIASPGAFKPFVQSLYIDLAEASNEPPRPIHLGFRAGRTFMLNENDKNYTVNISESTEFAGIAGHALAQPKCCGLAM